MSSRHRIQCATIRTYVLSQYPALAVFIHRRASVRSRNTYALAQHFAHRQPMLHRQQSNRFRSEETYALCTGRRHTLVLFRHDQRDLSRQWGLTVCLLRPLR